MKKLTKQTGFTLIELLLVITILAILAAMGIAMMRKSATTNRIDKSAIEMQQVLQAAMAYNVAEQKWPDNNNALPDCDVTDVAPFVNKYLPNNNYQSPYGNNYCWGQDSQKRRFWVALKVSGSGATASHMAQRLAARLPNAISTEDPTVVPVVNGCTDSNSACYVRSEIVVPGQSVQQGTMIAGIGNCVPPAPSSATGSNTPGSSTAVSCTQAPNLSKENRDQYNIHVTCPEEMQARVTVTPNFLQLSRFITRGTSFMLYQLQSPSAVNCTLSDGQYICPLAMKATVGGDNAGGSRVSVSVTDAPSAPNYPNFPGTIGCSYIAVCVASNTVAKGKIKQRY